MSKASDNGQDICGGEQESSSHSQWGRRDSNADVRLIKLRHTLHFDCCQRTFRSGLGDLTSNFNPIHLGAETAPHEVILGICTFSYEEHVGISAVIECTKTISTCNTVSMNSFLSCAFCVSHNLMPWSSSSLSCVLWWIMHTTSISSFNEHTIISPQTR